MDLLNIIHFLKAVIKSQQLSSVIFGSLGGATLTLFFNHKLKYIGKLSSGLILRELSFYKPDENGFIINVERNEAESMKIDFEIELYNGTETQKCITDLLADLYKGKKKLIGDLYINSSNNIENVQLSSVFLETIYIKPKEFKRVPCTIIIGNKSELLDKIIKTSEIINIKYKEIKHKKRLIKIDKKLVLDLKNPPIIIGGH